MDHIYKPVSEKTADFKCYLVYLLLLMISAGGKKNKKHQNPNKEF